MKSTPGVIAFVEAFREANAKSGEPWEQRDFESAFFSRKDWNFTHYFLPRRTHPAGYLVRLENDIIRKQTTQIRPHISHANGIGGVKNKTQHFTAQGLWEPNQDLPEDCSAGGQISVRVAQALAAHHTSMAAAKRHGGAADRGLSSRREPKHPSSWQGEDPDRT